MMNTKASAQNARKALKAGLTLTLAAREELLDIPIKGTVFVKPSCRELTKAELKGYTWARSRDNIALLELKDMIEPVCVAGPFQYGYQLTFKGRMIAEALVAAEAAEENSKPKRRYTKRKKGEAPAVDEASLGESQEREMSAA